MCNFRILKLSVSRRSTTFLSTKKFFIKSATKSVGKKVWQCVGAFNIFYIKSGNRTQRNWCAFLFAVCIKIQRKFPRTTLENLEKHLLFQNFTYLRLNLCLDNDFILSSNYNIVSFIFQVAAQNCRKRKLNLISHLQDEVDKYRQTKQNLLAERQELYRMRNEWTNKLLNLEDQVLRGLGKSSEDYSLELMPHSQQIRIAQRHTSTSATSRRHLTKPTRA